MQERHKESASGKTGAEALSSMLGLEAIEPEKEEEEPKRPIVLYLREGLKGIVSNWTKYPNEIHNIMAENLDKPAQGVLYTYLWRQSWGFGKNYCRVGYSRILKFTCIRSRWEAIQAVSSLKEKRFIVQALKEDGKTDTTQSGTIYRVFTPQEITSGIAEEGVLLNSIPKNGILCISIQNNSIPDNNSADSHHTEIQYGDNQNSGVSNNGMPDNNIPASNVGAERVSSEGVEIQYTVIQQHLKKKESLKNSLSQEEIISNFYKGIGQSKISKTKRERAENIFSDMIADGFNPEDIQLAVDWTLQNAKEKPYDFSIIQHTIGQAMAMKEEAEAKEAKRREEERIAAQERAEEEVREREAAKIIAYKEGLSTDESARLREKAEAELSNSGQFKEEFITEYLIKAKENDLIKDRLELANEPG